MDLVCNSLKWTYDFSFSISFHLPPTVVDMTFAVNVLCCSCTHRSHTLKISIVKHRTQVYL